MSNTSPTSHWQSVVYEFKNVHLFSQRYQKLFLVALTALFFFAACKSEAPKTESPEPAPAPVEAEAPEAEEAELEMEEPTMTEAEEAPAMEKPTMMTEVEAVKEAAPKVEKSESKKGDPESRRAPAAPAPPQPSARPVPVENEAMETPGNDKAQPAIVDMTPSAPVPAHDIWDSLLRKHVTSTGKVDYAGLKSDAKKLDEYLQLLQDNPPKDGDWSRKEKLAYWINVYNAFTVKLIVDNYPLASITDLHGGKPWDRKWIEINGKNYSLNNIENDIIRPRFNEPRIHFAVNCAAKSCPPLLNRAWTASNLSSNFDKQARAFINNPAFNSISAKKVEVSKIFEWYASDFGNLVSYLNKYASTEIKSGAKVEFKEYDWSLNN